MPLSLGTRGIMLYGLSVHPSEAWNTLFPLLHGSVGTADQPWHFFGLSVHVSVELIFVQTQGIYPSMTYLFKHSLRLSLYRQLEFTKLSRPDLQYIVGLLILRDVRQSSVELCFYRSLNCSKSAVRFSCGGVSRHDIWQAVKQLKSLSGPSWHRADGRYDCCQHSWPGDYSQMASLCVFLYIGEIGELSIVMLNLF